MNDVGMTMDDRATALEAICSEFLKFTYWGNDGPDHGELQGRHERIKLALEQYAPGMDSAPLTFLIYKLENVAAEQIQRLYQLAITTHPQALDGKLPAPMIDNAVVLQEFNQKEGHKKISGRGGSKTGAVQAATKAKPKMQKEWETWKAGRKGTQEQFADAVLKQFANPVPCTRNTLIKKWIPAWNKEAKK